MIYLALLSRLPQFYKLEYMPTTGSDIDQVKKISDEIRSSGVLGDESSTQNKLLEFLVEQYCAGTSESLNAYAIAIDAMGKPESFDPSRDSAVRGEMYKLRKSLETFFSGRSPNSPVISIPKGAYSIRLSNAEAGNPVLPFFRKIWIWVLAGAFVLVAGMTIAILASTYFYTQDKTGCSEELPNLSTRIVGENNRPLAEVVSSLIETLVEQYDVFSIASDQATCVGGTPHIQLEILLSGEGSSKLLSLKARDKQSGRLLLSRTFPLEFDQQNQLQINPFKKEMAEWVLTYGQLAHEAFNLDWESPEAKQNLQCVLMQYASFVSDGFTRHKSAVECMEDAVEAGTASATVYGFLSFNYLFQYVGHQKTTVSDPYGRAEKLLQTVKERKLKSFDSDSALLFYQVWRKDPSVAERTDALYIMESQYPDNTLVLIDLARITGYNLGDWEKAKKLSDQVLATHKSRDNSVTRIDATIAYLDVSNSDEKMTKCTKMYSENHVVSNMVILACALDSDDQEWIERTTKNMKRLGYSNWQQLNKFIERARYHPSFEKRLRQSYSKWEP